MASKKCPKCGEDNPAEAVMCWACYTPLTGGASMGATAAMTPGTLAQGPMGKSGPTPVPDDSGAKKGVDPKMIGVGGLLLVGVLAAVFMNMGSAAPPDIPLGGTDPTPMSGNNAPGPQPGLQPPPLPPINTGGGGPPVVAAPSVYTLKSPPNPRFATGTAGIMSNQPALSAVAARGLAKHAYDQLSQGGKWKDMQIVVFTDENAAKTFALYQAKRRSEKLWPADYQALAAQNVWVSAPAFFESRSKRESVRYPSTNPNAWWSR